ncbi:MAG TPA: HRDC domain-containing protein [Candidatus Dormibacteraeota bacterium]|nr:HRDC domain-containing protein [Candidatus Dormibacteraeota bacterium]
MIDSDQKLGAFLQSIHSATWVAVDTEADSLHAYPEKVCLIQISTAAGEALIDPLAEINLTPLLDALSTHELIMHGADYDLRLLCKHHRFVPKAIFDTMLAARLVGLRQFSLVHLVETYLGVKLEKGPQKANWAMRPLTERMAKYARNDTHYLRPLSEKLRAELDAKDRLAWHQESCARLIEECSADRETDMDSVWRLKGSHLLGRPALAVLRQLWLWREKEATASNKPPFFVLNHETLVDIAAAAATHRPLDPLLPRHLSQRRRTELLNSVEEGLKVPPAKQPELLKPTGRRPNEPERKRFMELQKRRDARAHELGIDPTLIASRAVLSALAHNYDKHVGDLMNWQRELLEK